MYKNQFDPVLREPKNVQEFYATLRPKLLDLQREFQAIQSAIGGTVTGRSVSGISGSSGGGSSSSDIYRASTATITIAGSNVITFSSAIAGTYTIVQCVLIDSSNAMIDLITKTSAQTASNFTVNTGADTGTLHYAILIVN